MKTSPPKHQIRWRISEELAAELAHVRRERGCKSWEEFLRKKYIQWQAGQNTEQFQSSEIQQILKSLCQRIEQLEIKWDAKLESIYHKVENHEQTIQSISQELAEAIEAFNRLIALLSVAIDSDPRPEIADHLEHPRSEEEKRVEEAINQIRRRI